MVLKMMNEEVFPVIWKDNARVNSAPSMVTVKSGIRMRKITRMIWHQIFGAAKYIEQFLDTTIKDGYETLGRLETLFKRRGKLPDAIKGMEEQAKREHYGQVLPIQEIRELVMKAATIVRMPCACRWTISHTEARCCYGVSFTPDAWYKDLDMSYFGKASDEGLETVAREEAIRQMKRLEETARCTPSRP